MQLWKYGAMMDEDDEKLVTEVSRKRHLKVSQIITH
jgi:hypothetical protein